MADLFLTNIRPITGEEMSSLLATPMQQGKVLTPDRIRESHHRVARLAAAGIKQNEIARRTNYTQNRISQLLQSPAMIDLVARYRARIDDAFIAEAVSDLSLANETYRMAQRQLLDRLDAADEEGADPIPLTILHKIATDGEDRFGTTKKSTQINLNADFATELEKALTRSNRTVDHKVIEVEPTSDGIRRRV